MEYQKAFREAEYIGSGLLLFTGKLPPNIPSVKRRDGNVISVVHAHLLYPGMNVKMTPRWWENIVTQSQQARDNDGSPIIIKLPEDNLYLVANFHSESFFTWLNSIETNGVRYERLAGGTIIDSPKWTEEANRQLTLHGVRTTSIAAEHITPMTERSIELEKFAQKAKEDGFKCPDRHYFPSGRTLMSHQIPVVLSLAKRGGGILADDVGSGKSSMFLCGYLSLAQYRMDKEGVRFNDVWPLVIVTKKALVSPIAEECDKWYQGVKVHKIAGKKSYNIPKDAQVIAVPLSSLDKCVEEIKRANPKGVIFDESHMIKSLTAKRTQAAVDLASYVQRNSDRPYIVAASATPMPNRPAELWSQLVVTGMSKPIIEYAKSQQKFPKSIKTSIKNRWIISLKDDILGDNMRFDMRYCDGKAGYFGWDNKGSSHEEELSKLLYNNGFIRRRKFEFITPLPLLHQHTVRCEISEEDTDKYIRAEEKFRDHVVVMLRDRSRKEKWSSNQLRHEIVDKLNKTETSEAIMKMTELRQLVEEIKIPSTVDWIHRFFAKDPSIVGRNGDKRKKLIVFVHHKNPQNILINHPELQKYGILAITSETKNVNEVVNKFQDWNSGKNLIILYSGAAEGITLTAASDVYILGLPFSFYNIIQMAGRCWARISELYEPHEAHVHYASSGLGIDNYLIKLIKSKSWLSKTIIDGEMAMDVLNDAESDENDDISEHKGFFSDLVKG